MIDVLYAIPWYSCNLRCTHCDIRNASPLIMNKEFISTVQNSKANTIVLFGGEPLFNKQLFRTILETDKINCVSTNMLLYTHDDGVLMKEKNISIATSWNPSRFTPEQYDKWLMNLEDAIDLGLPIKVLITLTPDLFVMDMHKVLRVFSDMEEAGVETFLFEHLISSVECNEDADIWLCKFHKAYKGKMINELEQNLSHWVFMCNHTYTLLPDGSLTKGCPQGQCTFVREECLTCEHASYCKPCALQKTCSYPKRLKELCDAT